MLEFDYRRSSKKDETVFVIRNLRFEFSFKEAKPFELKSYNLQVLI